ncbi:MAG TPA: NHL repeat-containing protein [Bryobacteraceae bacterium]
MKALFFLLLVSPAFADLIVTQGTLGVAHYTNDGVSLGTLIAPGTGGLSDARGVAVSPVGDLYISDFANDNILKFSPAGVFQGILASGANVDVPLGLALGTGGDLFVASAGAVSNIARVDPNTGTVTNPSFTFGNALVLGGPQYLTFGPNLTVTDIAGHLFRFDAVTGASISSGAFDNPVGVAFDSAGDLFMAQRISNNVLKFPAGGGAPSIVIPMGAFSGQPADLAIGPDGLLYLAATNAIYRFDLNGVPVDSFGTGGRYLAFTPSVPEPGTGLLLLAAFGSFAFLRSCYRFLNQGALREPRQCATSAARCRQS